MVSVDRKLPCFKWSWWTQPACKPALVAVQQQRNLSWGAPAGPWMAEMETCSYHSVPIRPGLGYCAKLCSLQFKGCPKEGHGQSFCVERLKQLCFHYLEKAGLQGPNHSSPVLKWRLQRGWRLPLHKCHMERTRGNGYKLEWERFHTERKKHFLFGLKAFIYWKNLPLDMAKSLFLKIFKMQLKRVVDIFIQVPFPTEAWAGRSFEVHSRLWFCEQISENTS